MRSDRIVISHIPVDLLSEEQIEQKVVRMIESKKKYLMLYTNAHSVQLANLEHRWMIEFYSKADMILCDGVGIQLAALLTGQSVPKKIAFNIWFWGFLKFIEGKYSIFLLGGSPSVIEGTVDKFSMTNPQLKISGYHNGYFDFQGRENRKVIQAINEASPDILLVGFGQPTQEEWISKNFNAINSKIIIACGGALDFFAGKRPVAPFLIRKLWLEWLFRFAIEPKRLLRRYTIGNIYFLKLVLKQRYFKKFLILP